MSESNAILSRLEADLAREREANAKSRLFGGIAVGVVALYVGWLSVQVARLLDPHELALAATGAAVGAVPDASQHIRGLVIDGAPDLAKLASTQVVNAIPTYRESLEDELRPVVDEVSTVLAEAAVSSMLREQAQSGAVPTTSAALESAAEAAVGRLDTVLAEALENPDDDGVTPRQKMDRSLTQLEDIDRDLKLVAAGKGDPRERELLLGLLNLMAQHHEMTEAALVEDYKAAAAAEAEAAPAEGAPAAPAEGSAAPAEGGK